MIMVTDEPESTCGVDRTDEKTNHTIVSSSFDKKAVVNYIELWKIDKILVQAGMIDGSRAQTFSFTRIKPLAKPIWNL